MISFRYSYYVISLFIATTCYTNSVAQEVLVNPKTDNDSTILKSSIKNEDLNLIKSKITNERIKLQKLLPENKNSSSSLLIQIQEQTLVLEESIVSFVEIKHSLTVNDSLSRRNNLDSELLLARLIYIRARTWYMQQSLEERIDEIYKDSKKSDIITSSEVIAVANLTNDVINNLENAKRFDRLKFRYNHKIVVSNWEHTANKLKNYSSNLENKDVEYDKRYKNMLSDLYLMIGVLDMF
ncbi:MAG: hypothetical protein ABFR62_11595 [Bacteroidota bacterium]